MKIIMYKLVGLCLMVLIGNSLKAQTILGPTEFCPGNNFIVSNYTLNDGSCTDTENEEWELVYPVTSGIIGTNPIVLTWSTLGSGPDQATLKVKYDCVTYDSDGNKLTEEKTAELIIKILNINTPIITSSSVVNLVCNETEFTVNLAPQQGSVNYSVSAPDCFSYSLSVSQLNFTTDNAASGEVCITVSRPFCGLSEQQCITVNRDCADELHFSSSSPISSSYNSVDNYITASNVSTTSFSTAEFKAGKAITLQPGFSANEVFLAHIGPCSCLPDGSTGCFYGKSAQVTSQGGNPTRGNRRRLHVSSNQVQEEKSILAATQNIEHAFTIYPNPSTGIFTISFDEIPSNTTIQVFDMMGRLRKSVMAEYVEQTIDVSELENGMYIIVLSSESTSSKEKIIIAK